MISLFIAVAPLVALLPAGWLNVENNQQEKRSRCPAKRGGVSLRQWITYYETFYALKNELELVHERDGFSTLYRMGKPKASLGD